MASGLENIETIESPFRRFVTTIGVFPTAFTDAMTYYECLAYLVKYLEETVIPAVNENAEALAELQQYYIHLKSYVDNYFANLDVQEEINNKLDQMALDGTLQEIITAYIQANVAWTFDTVADMKTSTNLVAGSYARTLGFHTLNDGGGATYKITDSGTANEMDVIAVGSLYANIVKDKVLSVKQIGAYGDDSHDDTTILQRALDICKNVNVPYGVYLVNAVTSIKLNNYNKLILDNDANIKAIPNDQTNYEVISLDNVHNVEISGGSVTGDRQYHTGVGGEWGHCIAIKGGSHDIYVHDVYLSDSWGDGIYVNNCTNVTTARIHVYNARRNGYSIVGAINFLSEDDVIEHTNGTAPQSGVDIEPNYDTDNIDNVVFNRLTSNDNTANGILFTLAKNNTLKSHITINDLYAKDNARGIFQKTTADFKGDIVINNPTIVNSKSNGILVQDTAGNHKTTFYRPIIDGYSTNGSGNRGIQIEANADSSAGNIYIIEPIVKNSGGTNAQAIYLYGRGASYPFETLEICDPIDLGNLDISTTFGKLFYSDKFEITKKNYTANANIEWTYNSIITNNGAESDIRFNISQNSTYESRIIKVVVESAHSITLRFTNQYIYPLSETISKDVVLSGIGSSVTIKKISSTEWIVLNSVGNVTVS